MPSLQSDLYVLPQGRTLCKSMPQQGCSTTLQLHAPEGITDPIADRHVTS